MTSQDAITAPLRPGDTSGVIKIAPTPSRGAAKRNGKAGHTASKTHLACVATCDSKIHYATPGAAQATIRGMARHGKAKNMRMYRCTNCGGWHITRK